MLSPNFYNVHEGTQGVSDIMIAKAHLAGEGLVTTRLEEIHSSLAIAQQGNSWDTEVGTFLGIWNIVTGTNVSGSSSNNVTREKCAVGESSQYFYTHQIINWDDFMGNSFEVYGSNKDYQGNEFDKLLLAVKRNNAHMNRYGGSDESAIAASSYISTGHISELNLVSPAYTSVWGGDTYVAMYDLTKARKASASGQGDISYPAESITDEQGVNMAFPVETTLNITLREGYHFANKEDFSAGSPTPLNQYILNAVFNSENDLFSYTAKPLTYAEVQHYPNRIYFSDVKVNNSAADGWRTYKPSNYADIDGNYGEINKLIVYNDVMYYLQDTAFGGLNINPVSTVKDSSGNNIVLGVGKKVIQEHKNISTYAGARENNHVISAQTGLYWFDKNTLKAFHFSPSPNQGLNPISDTKLMKSYFNTMQTGHNINAQENLIDVCLGYDYINNEILYSFYNSTQSASPAGVDPSVRGLPKETIVYNEMLKTFTSRYDLSTRIFISLPRQLFSMDSFGNPNDMYIHSNFFYSNNSLSWYGIPYESEIEFVVNKHPLNTKVFDNLEWYSQTKNGQDPISKMVGYTVNGSGAFVAYTDATTAEEAGEPEGFFPYVQVKESMTKMPVPRSEGGYRIREVAMVIRLSTNKGIGLILHYVKTLFRISRR